jgi:hypothetical protein
VIHNSAVEEAEWVAEKKSACCKGRNKKETRAQHQEIYKGRILFPSCSQQKTSLFWEVRAGNPYQAGKWANFLQMVRACGVQKSIRIHICFLFEFNSSVFYRYQQYIAHSREVWDAPSVALRILIDGAWAGKIRGKFFN